MKKLFFALWPDAAVRAALVRLQAGLDGKPTRPDKLHLTLAFLGQRPDDALPALRHILATLPARPMTLEIDRRGYFDSHQIAWAGMRAPPPELLALRAALMQALTAAQFAPAYEQDRFHPHITLRRKASPPPPAPFAPLLWRADEMVLAESTTQTGDYRILASRRLGREQDGSRAEVA
ncbi:MAG TPA: RNA 2',3'-cyclic phosphodiesterase [Janthinobacterium sp.]|jgi:2'-5' RNA ligase|nr:RNA 2',3'-cyclic phosphodiesterase [Janthinobacterium sp.]